MSKRIDLDELKKEYIGQTFGWLTVLDAYRDSDKGRYFFKCKCKCGNEVSVQYNKVTSGHTSSCGCYRHSEEHSNSLSNYWCNNKDKVKEKSIKVSEWCKKNHDKVVERGKRHSEFYKQHPEVIESQKEKRSQTLLNNPDIQLSINEKVRQRWDADKRSEFSNAKILYYKQHTETCEKLSQQLLEFYKSNPDRCAEISARNKEWCKNHADEVSLQGIKHSIILKQKRLSTINSNDISAFTDVLHPSQVDDFLNGNIKATDRILVKCSICGEYESRAFNNVWRLSDNVFKNGCSPICSHCLCSLSSSSYEDAVAAFVSEFYDGECVKNTRDIISPLELDLYYPEKKIAIEYNGSHWHDEEHKSKDYHYAKFKKCNDLDITLISIFERDWVSSKERVLSYIKDTFNDKENSLSFVDSNTVNLNYPPLNLDLKEFNCLYSNSYISRDKRVFTCGYASKRNILESLKFLTDIADSNSIEYFVNDKGDLEILNKNLCFHLADMLSGEHDSYDRWLSYHNTSIRCVFVYPPDLINQNRVNVYSNILLYHCGLAKRIYARNTAVKKYPAIKMKKFFEENNIAGYRNATVAYVLEDKKTNEPYMCYLLGHSFFGKGNYDCEIARGACKLGCQIIGGASKLWKHIINDNPNINSIVYYCDRRQYDQRSISHLMDSASMKDLGSVYMLGGGKSFLNYWLCDTYIDDKIWHRAGDYSNREPSRHKLVVNEFNNGNVITVENPGSFTNVFVRSGYHLEGLKVVKD